LEGATEGDGGPTVEGIAFELVVDGRVGAGDDRVVEAVLLQTGIPDN